MNSGLSLVIGFLAVVWLVVLVLRPKWLVVTSIGLCIVQFNWFARYADLPPYFSRVSLGLVGLLGVVLLGRHLAGKRIPIKAAMLRPFLYLGGFLVCLTLVSNLYNLEDLVLGLFELRYYFASLVFAFALYSYFGAALDARTFRKIIVYVALAQAPVAVLQYVAADGGSARTLDSVTGTFSAYGELVACQILALGLVMTDKLIGRVNTIRLNSYLVSLILILPLLLSKSRMATAFVVLIIGFSWIYAGFKKRNAGILIQHFYTIGVLAAVVGALFYTTFWQKYDIAEQFNPDYVYDYFMADAVIDYGEVEWIKVRELGRLSAITEGMNEILKDPVTTVIGYGSGAVSESGALGRSGRLYQEPGYGPLAGIDRNQYSKTIMEFGLLGIAGFVWFFAALSRKVKRMRLPPEVSVGLTVIIVCLIPMSFYALTLHAFFMSVVLALFLASAQTEVDRRLAAVNMQRQLAERERVHGHGGYAGHVQTIAGNRG